MQAQFSSGLLRRFYVSEIRNPNTELRKKSEIRTRPQTAAFRGFRHSDFFRISVFVIRISAAGDFRKRILLAVTSTKTPAASTAFR